MSLLDAVLLDDIELVIKHLSSEDTNKEFPVPKGTPLMVACAHGCLKVMKYLLEHGADVNHISSKGLTPLMEAVQSVCSDKGIQAIKLLIANGADLELMNIDGYTGLAIACEQGKLEFVHVLLASNAAVNCHCKSPLQLAVQHDHIEIVQELLASGADIVFEDSDMFRLAVEKGNSEMVKVFLDSNKVVGLNDVANGDTWSYLMEASFHGHDKVVEVLLKYEADVNLVHKSGNFALKVAANYGHIGTIKLLLDNNANVNLKGPDGCNALMSAIESDIGCHREEIVQVLIDRGTDISCESSSGMTALELAIMIQSRQSVEILLMKGAEVNRQCEHGWYPMQTPLMMACQFGTKEIVELLLKYKADVNLKDKSGGYALLYAVEQHDYEVSGLLLSLPEVNANLVTDDGRSAAKVLKDTYYQEIDSHNEEIDVIEINSILLKAFVEGTYDKGKGRQKVKLGEPEMDLGTDEVDYSPMDQVCVHRIHIEHNSRDHSYSSIFQLCFDNSVKSVEIDDAYIRKSYQFNNLEKFCEILKHYCRNLTKIMLTTSEDCDESERQNFGPLIQRLRDVYKVSMRVHYSGTIHDREVRFSNGWIVKMGRGLDLYISKENNYATRRCRETKIEIFHKRIVYNSH